MVIRNFESSLLMYGWLWSLFGTEFCEENNILRPKTSQELNVAKHQRKLKCSQ